MSLSFVYFDIVVVTCNYVSKVPSFIRIRFESGVWASFLVRSSCDSIFESFFGEDFRLSRAIFPFVALHEYYLKMARDSKFEILNWRGFGLLRI